MDSEDEPDWAALYAKHRSAMHKVAVRTLWGSGLADHAEDVVHEAITSLMASPPAPPIRNWEAILVTAVKRRAIDLLRSAPVRHADGGQPTDRADRTADVADEAAVAVDMERDGAVLCDTLATLDERERQILWHHSALGLTRDQVAKQFDISAGRVSQICIAAMRKLEPVLRERGVER